MSIPFETIEAKTMWDANLARIRKNVEKLPADLAFELERDLTSHLLEAYQNEDHSLSETARLQAALHRLGDPDEFLRETISDSYIERGTEAITPVPLLVGLAMEVKRGGTKAALAFVFLIGFVAALSFALFAILSPFLPMHVGFLTMPDSSYLLGFSSDPGVKEHLGWWRIPIGVLGSTVVWRGLIHLLVKTRRG